jgi:hypothetical protein
MDSLLYIKKNKQNSLLYSMYLLKQLIYKERYYFSPPRRTILIPVSEALDKGFD